MRKLWLGLLFGGWLVACRMGAGRVFPASVSGTASPAAGKPPFLSPPAPQTLPYALTPAPQLQVTALPHIAWRPPQWNGRSLLFVHGAGGSKEGWLRDMWAFSRLGFEVVAWDLPLHGDRRGDASGFPHPEGYIILQGAEELQAWVRYLRQQDAREVYVVARSLGTFVAARALGQAAAVEKAEFLLAGANLPYILEHGHVRGKERLAAAPEDVLRQIDPLYTLAGYTGAIHFHCGRQDRILTPQACRFAYEAARSARERRLFWHNTGHQMRLQDYFEEARAFFLDPNPP